MSVLFEEFKKKPVWDKFSEDQKRFVCEFFKKKNLYLTGGAGVGKSFVIQELFNFLMYEKYQNIGKTATTGVASFNIEGQTVYSFLGLGLGDEDVPSLIGKIRKNKKAQQRVKFIKSLLIDEVSMLKGSLLNKIDSILKYFRMNDKPFGGVQMIFVGDALQLGAIWKGDEEKEYFFQCRSWKEANIEIVELKQQMRQKNDNDFSSILNKIRFGEIDDLDILKKCINRKFPDDGIKPIYIYCKNIDVDNINKKKLAEIKLPSKIFRAKDSGLPHHIEHFNKNCRAAETIELKIGAQVILLRNLDTNQGFVNGSVGVIDKFLTDGILVKFKNGFCTVSEETWEIKEQQQLLTGETKYKVVATRTQIPLKVAYSGTVHSMQGMTLDRAVVDMNGAFSAGQVYVSLSRVKDLESLSIVNFPTSKIWADQECLDFYQNINKKVDFDSEEDNNLIIRQNEKIRTRSYS